jgi:hypothetical protein
MENHGSDTVGNPRGWQEEKNPSLKVSWLFSNILCCGNYNAIF